MEGRDDLISAYMRKIKEHNDLEKRIKEGKDNLSQGVFKYVLICRRKGNLCRKQMNK